MQQIPRPGAGSPTYSERPMPRGRLLRHALDPNYAVKGDVSQKRFHRRDSNPIIATEHRDGSEPGLPYL